MGRLIDADKIIFHEIDEIGGEYEPYLGCSKDQICNLPTIEAIPKADYETRLKADLAAMLEELDLQIDEFDSGCGWDGYIKKIDVHGLIQQKINDLKVVEDGKNNE